MTGPLGVSPVSDVHWVVYPSQDPLTLSRKGDNNRVSLLEIQTIWFGC